MLLDWLTVRNYRCFESLYKLPLEAITCFIGPNDSGKSSVLLLLRHCFENTPIPPADFRDSARPIVVELGFHVSQAHEAERAQDFMYDAFALEVRKEFVPGSKPTTCVFRRCYTDDRFNRLDELKIAELEVLIADMGVKPPAKPRTKDDRLAHIRACMDEAEFPQHDDWMPVGPELNEVLPEFLLFGADEDLSLQSGPLMTTLQQVYKHFLQHEPPPELQALQEKAAGLLRNAVEEINPIVGQFAGVGIGLKVEPTLDFLRGLNVGEVLVQGPTGDTRAFSRWGDGTKRRIVLALFHWSHHVLGKIAEAEQRSLLWCFDEPDTHLYYRAQHELLGIIKELAAERMQVLLCTHSPMLIDRLPAKSVRHMLPDATSGCTDIDYLEPSFDGEGIEAFLRSVGSGVGFANSLLFYERCFLIVEGPTEEKALPILYRMLHNEDPIERGLRVFAAENNKAVVQLARLLHSHGKTVVMLIDSDSVAEVASHLDRLAKEGLDISKRVVYIGTAEFEDAFSDDALLRCLNARYARADGRVWSAGDITRIRAGGGKTGKFSEDLRVTVSVETKRKVTKPELARQLAESLAETGDPSLVPTQLHHLFQLMRTLADGDGNLRA